jgi:ATP-dependent helicase/nuclease subunit A
MTQTVESSEMRALTAEQEEAIARRDGPLLLAAGAGSGKTSVLVERFVRAVREDGIAPGRILAITFTERAAGELRERVRARLLQLGEREAARDLEGAPIGTFHGFCARLLRVHALTAGLDPDFAILDEASAGRLAQLAFRRALAALVAERPPTEPADSPFAGQASGGGREAAVDLVAAYGADRVRAMVLRVYAEQRSRGAGMPRLPVPALAAQPEPLQRRAVAACALLDELLEGFGRAYGELKRVRGALDFDDLELRARALLAEHEGMRAGWAQRLELLMVDEFQDTNRRQLAILELLERENLFTVGDELQSIYGFRHAEVELFRERRRELDARGEALALIRNFRGRPPLIAAVNGVFGQLFGDAYTPLMAAREDACEDGVDEGAPGRLGAASKEAGRAGAAAEEPLIELLLTDRRGWGERGLADEPLAHAVAGALPAAPLWRQAEARLLAQRVAELVAAGHAALGDVAVLLRAAGDLPVYERALEERGLRTLAAVGSFWGHQQVGDLLAWLRALANPLDELALYSTLASPLVGVSSDGLALLARAAHTAGEGVWETARRAEGEQAKGELHGCLPAADRERLERFVAHFTAEREAAPAHPIAELLLRALAWSGYERHVSSLSWGERRLANIHKLLRLARDFEAAEGRDLRGFLDHIAHREAFAESSEPHAPAAGAEPDAVRLMTIHAAKGLEFPVVCVADLGRAGNGMQPDLLVDGERVGLRLASLDGSEPVACLEYERLYERRREAEAAEEERIVYVAMTRARERLLLSGAVDFERWPAARPGGAPIAWLGPALAGELPERARTLEHPVGELAVGADSEARMRCWLSAPATVGLVLREESLHPVEAGHMAIAQEPPQGSAGRGPSAPGRFGESSMPELPTALSCTALGELERCGYRYYLEHVLGLPENRAGRFPLGERREGLDARTRGVLMHKLLQHLDFARADAPSPRDVTLAARELGVAVAPREREQIAALVRAATTTTLARRLAKIRSPALRREYPFAFLLPADPRSAGSGHGAEQPPEEPAASGSRSDQLVTGVFDVLVSELDGRCLILDYKSDRVGEREDLQALVEREYGVQRLLYALAALCDGASEVDVIHWFLERPREWVVVRFRADRRPQLERQLLDRIRGARERGFAVSRTPHRGLCATCPGRAGLCSWDEAETLRDWPVAQPGGGR